MSEQVHRVEIRIRKGFRDPRGAAVRHDLEELGVTGVREIHTRDVYYLKGALSPIDLEVVGRSLLADPIVQEFSAHGFSDEAFPAGALSAEVLYNTGVMDPVEASTMKGLRDLGVRAISAVKTAVRYIFVGTLSEKRLAAICEKLLVNKKIQHLSMGEERVGFPDVSYSLVKKDIVLGGLTGDELVELSTRRQLALNREEMEAIQAHYRALGREPTDAEVETLAQTWSEHCVHKTLRGPIDFEGNRIDNLLKTTVFAATRELAKEWCVSVFSDNAGVIRFDDDSNVCFKVETHNFPSALEPYGGAATGIGGVIRDILGVGMGAKPIANTDIFCFAPPDFPADQVPPGVMHPRRIFKGVVSGVRDYGNRMGIPTVNGAICFHERYLGNPIVYCGTIGIMPKDMSTKKVEPGDRIVVVGGGTGRDGIHGATLSSVELTDESEIVSGGAVQIGNPIEEKRMTDVLLVARDRGLYRAVTDCGAGGLSSAVGEMGKETGAVVDLDRVPLKYSGLSYTEIWISESQERMVLAVPPDNVPDVIELFRSEDVVATDIGEFSGGKLHLRYEGETVGELDLAFMHDGYPKVVRNAVFEPPGWTEPDFECPEDLGAELEKVLSTYNVASKEWVIRQYDHEVQGGSVLKPLVGVRHDGPGDAAVLRPKLDSYRGIAIGCGINPRYGLIDPYPMAACCIDEALRAVVAVGGDPDYTAILDNFAWGKPAMPDRMGGLVRAASACYTYAKAFGAPFISGKDSLNNEFTHEGKTIVIPPTLLISSLSVIEDVRKCVTPDLKKAHDLLYLVGETKPELGGSQYYLVRDELGTSVPQVNAETNLAVMRALHAAIKEGLVRACHDLSEGGLAVAAAEMAFSGELGAEIELARVPAKGTDRSDHLLFSESAGRFLVEVDGDKAGEFASKFVGLPCAQIGRVTTTPELVVTHGGLEVVRRPLSVLKERWQAPLREV
jgi:phosphoribosylformylglycinamidine synthase